MAIPRVITTGKNERKDRYTQKVGDSMVKLRVGTEKERSIFALIAGVMCSAVFLICLFFSKDTNNLSTYLYIMAAVWLTVLLSAFRWIDFSENEVCMYNCYIFRRRVSADRITSIEFAVISGKIMLILCFDGHRPYSDFGLSDSVFFMSRKVYQMLIFEDKCDECIEKLTELYGEVTLCDSYKKHRSKKK